MAPVGEVPDQGISPDGEREAASITSESVRDELKTQPGKESCL